MGHASWTLGALVGFAFAASRVSALLFPRDTRTTRAALALVLGAVFLCSAYGVLGQLCERKPADVELVFFGDKVAAPKTSRNASAGELRAIDDQVVNARATPRNVCLFGIAFALASLALPRGRRAKKSEAPHPAVYALVVPIALAGLAGLWSVPRGYDALWYHLPMASAFARNGHLEPAGRDLVFYFPGNLELLARTLADLLSRVLGASAMAIVQLPFVFAAAVLSTATARRLGAARASWLAGALVLSCPIVVFQAGLAYADVLSLAALAAGLPLLHDAVDGTGLGALLRALAAGACLGLALGAKYAAIPLIATGLSVLAIYALRSPSGRVRVRNATRALALGAMFVVGLVPPAWFWYLRNLRLTDNPIFPIAVPALGLRGLFLSDAFNRGKELELVGSHLEWLAYPFVGALSHESGFGAAFTTLVPIALVVLCIVLARRVLRGHVPRFALLLAWGLIYLASWWLGTPHEARHLLPLVILLGAPATLLLRGNGATPAGLRVVACTALLLSTIVLLRIELFGTTHDLSVRRTSFAALYDVPEDVIAALPKSARIANLASRPYNFALLGSAQTLPLIDYAPGTPDQAALRYRGATHIFVRGALSTVEESLLRVRGTGPPLRLVWQAKVPLRADFAFWGATDTDLIALYELAHEVGDSSGTR